MYNISIIVLLVVFILIAVRKIGRVKFRIWQIMLFGAVMVLLTGQISPLNALKSINLDVMLFLFGMFIVGEALYESGYLFHLSYRLFKRAKNVDQMILLILFIMGISSAFLMNDTLAIIGTPLVLYFAEKYSIPPKLLLLCLAFAVTTGSVMSPIGNPQNLLIAISGNVLNPFITFFKDIAVPTLINLFLAYVLLRLFYKDNFQNNSLSHFQEPVKDYKLAFLSKVALVLIIILVMAKTITAILGVGIDFRLTYIALTSALPIIVFSQKRFKIIKNIDWHTLIFFAAMFVLMESVWNSGFFQAVIKRLNINITSIPIILTVSIILSQLISNVPFVALYLPLLTHVGASTNEMMALAAGSTIAGNLLILGAASNVIIIQNAEKRGETLTFFEFAKIGLPLTILNAIVYGIFLILM